MLEEALRSTGIPVAYAGWSKAPNNSPYLVYLEDGANDLIAGNRHVEKATRWTVDLYLRGDSVQHWAIFAPEDADAYKDLDKKLLAVKAVVKARIPVEDAFDDIGAAWSLNSVQFEQDTGLIHIEWLVETCGND